LNKAKFLKKSFGRKRLLAVLVSVLLLTTIMSQVAPCQTDKEKTVRQVAEKWIQVGVEQYQRGFYRNAEQSFLRALDYQQYLSAVEQQKLSDLLEKTHIAVLERKRILSHLQTADELVKKGERARARAHLEKVKDSEYLTEGERQLVVEGLESLQTQLGQKEKETAELYQRSVQLYHAGQLEKAREGFIKVVNSGVVVAPEGERAEDYLLKIDETLVQGIGPGIGIITEPEQRDERTISALDRLVGVETESVLTSPRPLTTAGKGGYIDVITSKNNRLRSYTKVVVNDAVAKVESYINQGEFDKAKEAVETAERLVNENQLRLGEDAFREYSGQLGELMVRITQGRAGQTLQLEQQKRLEAVEAQRTYREQTELDRKKRVNELMDNAFSYQKQQRYEEALGQLEGLLAIDPLNNNALITKKLLRDMINFRKQLEIQKETDKERIDTLVGVKEAMIPYADEMTYPKNWREIIAKRRPEEAIGQDPATVAVYKQLDQVVDLSELTAEMPFSEAIEELKNSVDPPLKVTVFWRDLYDNADIDQTTTINMDPISAVPLGTALDLLLKSVSGGFADLGYVVEDGVVTVATVESLPSKVETLVYDVTDLLGRPADFFAQSSGEISVSGGSESAGGEGFEEDDEIEREELTQMAALRAQNLTALIQETVEPDSWYDVGGEGTITIHENKKLIVLQTREVHNKINALLNELRKALGHQVAIESRFLVVGENFLEDIGFDVDFVLGAGGGLGKFGTVDFQQESDSTTLTQSTAIPGSFGGTDEFGVPFHLASTISGGYGAMLDDLQVRFLIRATQAHRDATSLTAPKVSVVSGESATIRVQRIRNYPRDIDIDIEEIGTQGAFRFTVEYEEASLITGTLMNITPTIMNDKKHVLLNIVTELRDFLGFVDNPIQLPVLSGDEIPENTLYTVPMPETEISRVETRVSVPDGGTLLLGGQKVTTEVEKEGGVPVLSKIPVLGRLFSNRSEIKDSKILLILVKPTIILQEEAEAEAIAAMDSSF
jgi:type II secretory pathway component GspD/PulD (secretin)/tetratricopeptide (TPR) repeat protein